MRSNPRWKAIIPKGDFTIAHGDKLSVVAAPQDINAFFRSMAPCTGGSKKS